MTGRYKFHGREITITTQCMYSPDVHWHGAHVAKLGPGYRTSAGIGRCMTSSVAFVWLLTGWLRKIKDQTAATTEDADRVAELAKQIANHGNSRTACGG